MKISLTSLSVMALGCALLAGASSCRVEAATAKKYNGPDEHASEAWQSGGAVTVDGVYGDITVVQGSADVVNVTFEPFNYGAFDKEEEAREDLDRYKELVVEASPGGGVHISTGRTGGGNGIGADIEVALPPDFDASLVVENKSNGPVNPGNVDVQFVGAATSVTVSTDTLGSCTVRGATTVTSTTADCDGEVDISGVSDNVDVTSTGLETGDAVRVSLASVSADATGGSITAEDGNIELTVPASGNFAVTALTQEGVVNVGDLGGGLCREDVAEERSKTVTCGDQGTTRYDVTACTDGLGECNITIGYN